MSEPFELSRNLVQASEEYDDAGSARVTWMAALSLIVDVVARPGPTLPARRCRVVDGPRTQPGR